MRIRIRFLLFFFCLSITFVSCQKDEPVSPSRLVISITADVKTISPLYAFSVDEGNLCDLLFLSLAKVNWDEEKGDVALEPLLAESWQWSPDSSSVQFYLRKDIEWSDGQKLTAEDVAYSFFIYSHPEIQSRFFGTFEKLFLNEDLSIDLSKSIQVIDSFTIKINFKPDRNIKLVDIIHPVIPKHIYERIKPEEMTTAEINFKPISSGPYKLKRWTKNQMIILEARESSFLFSDEMIREIVFKVLPDYNSRITQLKKGEIDLVEQIKPDIVDDLINTNRIEITSIKGREFEFAGWNHIDPKIFTSTGELQPNKFFSSVNVRLALSYAINRDEILREYLHNFGQPSVSPISEVFKDFYDEDIEPIEYNTNKARELLKKEGWIDHNNNGIIDKDGIEFSFILSIAAGNPLRQYSATIIKNNLKAVGIDVKIETLELNKLIDDLFNKKLDAWLAAFGIQIPIDNKIYWYSDLNVAPFNFISYKNTEVDAILDRLEKKISYQEEVELQKAFQKLIYNDQPVTFLFWKDNIVGINKKISDYEINPLGAVQHLWDWRIN